MVKKALVGTTSLLWLYILIQEDYFSNSKDFNSSSVYCAGLFSLLEKAALDWSIAFGVFSSATFLLYSSTTYFNSSKVQLSMLVPPSIQNYNLLKLPFLYSMN